MILFLLEFFFGGVGGKGNKCVELWDNDMEFEIVEGGIEIGIGFGWCFCWKEEYYIDGGVVVEYLCDIRLGVGLFLIYWIGVWKWGW